MDTALKIGDLVEVPSVRTVVRIEEGRDRSEEIAGSFVFTPEVAAHFAILADAFLRDHGRGYFLQGDFGSGKSHFLAALAAWAGNRPGAGVLAEKHGGLRRAGDEGKRLLPVDVSLVNYRAHTSLEQIVAGRIEEVLADCGHPVAITAISRFQQRLTDLLGDAELRDAFAVFLGIEPEAVSEWLRDNPRDAYLKGAPFLKGKGVEMPDLLVEDRLEVFSAAVAAARAAGYTGILLLLDELSEFFRSKRTAPALNEDARTLQLLGEMSQTEPLWIVAAVQESIERTGDVSPGTLQKIKDRYPVKLVLSSVHIKSLIGGRLVRRRPGAEEHLQRLYEVLRQQFATFKWSYEEFRSTYPVHPATIAMLDGLGSLFSVHRGIVDFVCAQLGGDPQRRIPGILERPALELLAPDSIYDHFAERMAEFSAFHVFPRHVVPHLDDVAREALDEPEDQALARRLVRMLVLYEIHPTAKAPKVRELTELAGCALSSQDPGMGVEFVSEAILDPLVEDSRFLVKRSGGGADKGEAVYAIVTQDDPGKGLKRRVERTLQELPPGDTRPLAMALGELPESAAWPGGVFLDKPTERLVNWRLSSRRVLTAFLRAGGEAELHAVITNALRAGAADMAVVLCVAGAEFHCEHAAVWRVPVPDDASEDGAALREHLALAELADVLRPSSPAEGPLIPLVRERLRRQAPAAQQGALSCVYAGEFVEPRIAVDDAVRQLRRFDRVLEIAAERVLEERYPRFREIAPRRVAPFPRLYQKLLDDFVFPGEISMRKARGEGMVEPIEGLAMPLGLATLRSGSYVFAPDPGEHALLRSFFGLLKAAGPTPVDGVLCELRTGPFGVPDDAARFLLSALAIGGLVTLMKNGRSLPLDFLRLASPDTADAVAPGEVIGQGDRETLLRECGFLMTGDAGESFGLRQQREAWQAVIKFKRGADQLIGGIRKGLGTIREYSAFATLDMESLERRLEALLVVSEGIRVSYQSREGLERFLQAWRGSGLCADDIALLKNLRGFLARRAEQIVFVNHYVSHPVVASIAAEDADCSHARQAVLRMLDSLETIIAAGDEGELDSAFSAFRDRYAAVYERMHAAAQGRRARPRLSKFAARAVAVLERVAAIDCLDRPAGLDALLAQLRAPGPDVCRRSLREELLRAPVCGCGFQPGDEAETSVPSGEELERRIERCLTEQAAMLRSGAVREALHARAYALADSEPPAAKALERVARSLAEADTSGTALLDMLDEQTTREIGRALAGRVNVHRRSLSELAGELAGRRLTRSQAIVVAERWMGNVPEGTILAFDGDGSAGASVPTGAVSWWPLLHPDLAPAHGVGAEALAGIEAALEARYPSGEMRSRLERLEEAGLARFVAGEPFHVRAVQAAWGILAERVLAGGVRLGGGGQALCADPDADRARARSSALGRLTELARRLPEAYPERLCTRLAAAELLVHPWATAELQKGLYATVADVASEGKEWLESLPAVAAVALDRNPLVVVLDGVSPDVWLAAHGALAEAGHALGFEWRRTETAATIESMQSLLGLDCAPSKALPALGIPYHQVRGNDEAGLRDLVAPLETDRAVVVRIGLLDSEAHRGGGLRLHEMPSRLERIFTRDLLPLASLCGEQKRPMVVTADHGLSLTSTGLTHGRGGVYEQAIPLVEMAADPGHKRPRSGAQVPLLT